MGEKSEHRLMDRLVAAYEKPRRPTWRVRLMIFVLVVGPVVVLAAYSYRKASRDLTELTFLRRQAIAYLAAVSLRTKFDGLITIAQTAVDNEATKKLIAEGKWEEALKPTEEIPRNLPYVLILSLYSPDGRFMASIPRSETLAVGTDLSYRPWYKGVSRTWLPYVSDLGKTASAPYENRVLVSVPIKSADGAVIGIFNLSIRIDAFLSWSRAIDAGSSAFVYFTDRLGQVAGHKYLVDDTTADLPDQSAFPPVQKAIAFDRGIELLYDPAIGRQAVVAYEPVLRYGWTAIVEQAADDAFASRDANTRSILLIYGGFVAFNCLLVLLVFRFIDTVAGLRRREKLFLESIGEGLLVLDRRGAVIMANPAAETLLARRLPEMFGMDIADAAPLRDEKGRPVSRDRRPVIRALAGSKVVETGQYVDSTGRAFFVDMNVSPMKIDQEVVGAVVVFRDVTKDQELERAKKEFVSIASHQLLTPVSTSKGYLAMLMEGDFGDFTKQQKEYLGKLLQLNQRMIELVDDLLNLSRVELGVLESTIEPMDVADFMREEIRAIESLASAKKISIRDDFSEHLPEATLPPRLIRIIVQNLLSNAVKYTPDGGSIRVTLRRTVDEQTGENILISVADTGIGIPGKDRAGIFSKFFRAENAQSSNVDGTGLGLYIVKSVVDALKGRIRFETAEGKGTTFIVEIPVRTLAK
ncbi:MAG TPA: ATP-binding protein [Candidatus Eisenbacteria bacterium]|nr:ATP-binding protein [Candidatus Eisenbacteria bacterium]